MFRLAVGVATLLGSSLAADWQCLDVNSTNDERCFRNIEWAMNTGKHQDPEFYPKGTTTFPDFQCALFLKMGLGPKAAHNCTLPPCTPISTSMDVLAGAAVRSCVKPVEEELPELVPGSEDEPSMPWYAWVLIASGVGLLILLGAWAMGLFPKTAPPKKKKTTRAAKLQEAPRAPEPQPEPVKTVSRPLPVYEVAPPVYISSAAPIYQATQKIAVAPAIRVAAPRVY
eukprot:TRINITY_DN102331_c0_g1_i1.p1 TRINITY_DN102331_c0_g1~~TRINITY_DN102331_c0_g1_i1.p1  ORF type:complete len:227 (+),score=33.86 TRINITY_DN102331_c0_g1_i1:60-740(+)